MFLCGFVFFTIGRFMLSLALLFVLVVFQSCLALFNEYEPNFILHYGIYTERLKKPDTFCFPLTRKVQILELNVNANFTYRTSKSIFDKIYLSNTKRDIKTSKIAFLSILSRKCMSKAIF